MAIRTIILPGFIALMLYMPAVVSASSNPLADKLDEIIKSKGDEKCADIQVVTTDTCKKILTLAGKSLLGDESGLEEIKRVLKKDLLKPETINSVLAKKYGDDVPLGLEFKSYDSKNGGSVLGLSYSVDYSMVDESLIGSKDWNKAYSIDFKANGNIVNEKIRNPRNFLDTKFTLASSYTTRIPEQSEEFARTLTELTLLDAQCEGEDTEICKKAREAGLAMLDSAFKSIKAFQRYEYGIDAGYESDQGLDARQSKVSIYLFGQYEEWGNHSLLGAMNLTPALRIGVDSIDPNDETPRALAGDDSSYYRFSSELSLWWPVKNYLDLPVVLTFNHRYYHEINASAIVENADLDSFNLRTYSLTGSNGLYVSYSSGKLPLDVGTDEVVELGWKTYF